MQCSSCHEGTMVAGRVENYDATSIVGLEDVVLGSAPALVCDRCGHVMFEGRVVDIITRDLARLIIQHAEELRPGEARFLREVIGMTQAELAERLRINRATVNRWETGDDVVGPVQSLALRTVAAWSLNDPALAREIGGPVPRPPVKRVAPPYRLKTVAA